jgi:hypothetical protein
MRLPSRSLLWERKLFSMLFIGENSAHRAWLWRSFEVFCSSILQQQLTLHFLIRQFRDIVYAFRIVFVRTYVVYLTAQIM